MYRFRTIKNILGEHQELERQEIYFSDMDALNDPIEGFRDFYWSGDLIVWRNFLKHYLLCLEHMYMLAYLSNEDQILLTKDIPIYKDETKLPTEQYRQMFREICDRFFQNESITQYLGILATPNARIGRDELFVHLKTLHLLAIDAIMKTHVEHKL